MTRIFRTAAAMTVAAAALIAAGCDSQAEQEVEKQAEAIDESYEAEADLTEALAEGGPNEAAAENQADALRAEGENIKDNLEEAADELDSTPQ